jgi:hypothetical protein
VSTAMKRTTETMRRDVEDVAHATLTLRSCDDREVIETVHSRPSLVCSRPYNGGIAPLDVAEAQFFVAHFGRANVRGECLPIWHIKKPRKLCGFVQTISTRQLKPTALKGAFAAAGAKRDSTRAPA